MDSSDRRYIGMWLIILQVFIGTTSCEVRDLRERLDILEHERRP